MTTYVVKKATPAETAEWLRLRARLWPDTSPADHGAEAEAIWEKPLEAAVYLALDEGGKAAGFAEVFKRGAGNEDDRGPVAFLKGIWVDPMARGKGVGRRLIEAAACWGREMDCKALGSDVVPENRISFHAHKAWGFEEVESGAYFRMKL